MPGRRSTSILGFTNRWRENERVGARSRAAMAGRPVAVPSPGPPSHTPSAVNSPATSSAIRSSPDPSTTLPAEYRWSTNSP